MKINYNEGGYWFTFWFSTEHQQILRVWFGPRVKGFVLFSISFAIYNPWKAERDMKEFMSDLDWKKVKERITERRKKNDV